MLRGNVALVLELTTAAGNDIDGGACWRATPNMLRVMSLQIVLARPLPWLACKMNALATWFTCQWLMGPSKVNDEQTDDGKVCWIVQQVLSPRHTCLSGIGSHCCCCLIES